MPPPTTFRGISAHGGTEHFRELAVAHADGSIGRVLVRLSRTDVLLLDDIALAPLKDAEHRDFLEIGPMHLNIQLGYVLRTGTKIGFKLLRAESH